MVHVHRLDMVCSMICVLSFGGSGAHQYLAEFHGPGYNHFVHTGTEQDEAQDSSQSTGNIDQSQSSSQHASYENKISDASNTPHDKKAAQAVYKAAIPLHHGSNDDNTSAAA